MVDENVRQEVHLVHLFRVLPKIYPSLSVYTDNCDILVLSLPFHLCVYFVAAWIDVLDMEVEVRVVLSTVGSDVLVLYHLNFVIILDSSQNQDGPSVYFLVLVSPQVRLGKSNRMFPSFCFELEYFTFFLGEGVLNIKVVGVVLYLADVDEFEVLNEVVPKHEEGSTLPVLIAQFDFIIRLDSFPKLRIVFRGSSVPLNVSPGVPQFQHVVRSLINLQLS